MSADSPVRSDSVPHPLGDVEAMREALATYLAALGRMADDGVLPYPENPFVELAPQAGRAGTGGEQPVAALGAVLRRATRQNNSTNR